MGQISMNALMAMVSDHRPNQVPCYLSDLAIGTNPPEQHGFGRLGR